MWKQVNSQEDIDYLLDEYYGFHDSCITAVEYISGAKVDEKGSMSGIDKNCALIVRFDSQMPLHKLPKNATLELKFIGLRRMNLIGYQENYFSDISSCYLAFYKDFIVWSEDDYFEPETYNDDELLKRPMYTFVVADRLEWRFV